MPVLDKKLQQTVKTIRFQNANINKDGAYRHFERFVFLFYNFL